MKKVVLFIVVLLVAGGLVFIPSLLAGNGQAAPAPGRSGRGQGAGTVFAVRTAAAEKRTLQAYLEVNGNIVSEQQVAVVPDAAGKLVSVTAGLGSIVRKGDLLAEVDPSRPGSAFSLSPVYAPVSGMVVSNPPVTGSTVSTSTTLFTISAAGSTEIEALIPEREVGQLRVGLRAEVRLEAFSGEVFTAEVARLSPVVDPSSRTKKITLRFVREDRRINPGMFARIRLNTRSYPNVVSVPQEALVDYRGTTAVYVLEAGEEASVAVREVTAGAIIDGEVEVKSGLDSGEAVVVQGQQFLTDGAPVRVIGQL